MILADVAAPPSPWPVLFATILVALISALAALVVAGINSLATRSNQHDIEKLKDRLAEGKAERDAQRDYRYEALKRLYHECDPLVFQLLEQADLALQRILNLAKTASQGDLAPDKSWLARDYYGLSTFHRLLAPLATMRLLHNRLTIVDLSLDPYIYCVYLLCRQIADTFSDDFKLRKAGGDASPYNPHHDDAEKLRVSQQEQYWQQGIPSGILDNAVQSLFAREADGSRRVMTFGEFETQYKSALFVRAAIDRIRYLFEDFHPRTRPVLWRVLIAQAALYRALLRVQRHGFKPDISSFVDIPKADRARFDWRGVAEMPAVPDADVLEKPFDAVEKYFRGEKDSKGEKGPMEVLEEKLRSQCARAAADSQAASATTAGLRITT